MPDRVRDLREMVESHVLGECSFSSFKLSDRERERETRLSVIERTEYGVM